MAASNSLGSDFSSLPPHATDDELSGVEPPPTNSALALAVSEVAMANVDMLAVIAAQVGAEFQFRRQRLLAGKPGLRFRSVSELSSGNTEQA